MMTLRDEAVAQLADAAGWAHGRLLAYHLIDEARTRRPLEQWAQTVVAELTCDDPHIAAGAAQTCVEWSGPGSTIDPCWWDTPLGILVAATREPDDGAVTQQQAADVLGVDRRTVLRMLDDGRLAPADRRGPTGGTMVDRRSVATLLVDRELDA